MLKGKQAREFEAQKQAERNHGGKIKNFSCGQFKKKLARQKALALNWKKQRCRWIA